MVCRSVPKPKPDPQLPILQLKVRLLDVSPMVWRRLLVPATATLQELHGILGVAMGWEGIHLYRFDLRAVGYGSLELCTGCPGITLDALRLRIGSKLRYTYDMGDYWQHEVRVEDLLPRESQAVYPLCTGGDHPCPLEDSGGPAGWRERRLEAVDFDALEDMAEMADVRSAPSPRIAAWPCWTIPRPATASSGRSSGRGSAKEFCRIQVNDRFRRKEHKRLMHQQVW